MNFNLFTHFHIRDPATRSGRAKIPSYDCGHPPTIIKIKSFEPLQLAKKKHYFQSPTHIDTGFPLKVTKKKSRSGSTSSTSSNSSVSSISSRSSRSSSRSSVSPPLSPVSKSQGRPFNESLNARFLYFDTIDDMISEMLNNKVDMLTLITNFSSFRAKGFSPSNSMELRVRIPKDDSYFEMQQLEFNKEQLQLTPLSSDYEDEDYDEESYTDNNTRIEIAPELCKAFDTDDLSFVKIIRDNKGKLIKFEVLSDVKNQDLTINYIKKFITYPRYKAKMKIYLIRGRFDRNIWFYNDMRMLIWDLENTYLGNKKILINNAILDIKRKR